MSSKSLLACTQPFGDTAGRHLRTLGNLIATNSEVRKILSDFSVIGRDILARTASHAAETVRPNQDALTNIDRPAPLDQFETAGGPNGTPVAELNAPGSDTAVRHHPLQGVEVEHEGQVRSASQAADEVQQRASAGAKDTVEYVFVTTPSHIGLTSLAGLLRMVIRTLAPKNLALQVACRISRQVPVLCSTILLLLLRPVLEWSV